jgi:GxxExxY protein
MNTQNDLETMLKQSLATGVATMSASGRWAGLVHPELSHAIVGAAIEVHRRIGPGQLESVYQRALACELRYRAIEFEAQVPIAMQYRDECVGEFLVDFIVDDKVVLELKAVERFHPAHTAQVLSYLRATKLRLGLLMNFNAPTLVQGVRRIVL